MNVLCTGAAGFIGSHIVDGLLKDGHTVLVVDDLSSGNLWNLQDARKSHTVGQMSVHCMSILNPCFLGLVGGFKPEVIFHEAAQASLLRSMVNPMVDASVNIIGTLNVIRAARKLGAYVIMASTSAVYDAFYNPPFSEKDRIDPDRPYGISKAAAEMYLRNSGLGYTILRYGNVFGPRQVAVGENQLIPRALDHLLKGKPFVVNGDGNQTRDFVYVADVVRANLVAMRERENGTFNIATGIPNSVNYVLKCLAKLTGQEGHMWEYGPAKPNEPRHVVLAVGHAAWLLDFYAHTNFEAGLNFTVEWYKENAK